MGSLKFLLGLGNWSVGWDLINKAVPLAEEQGFWGVTFPDHYMWMPDDSFPSEWCNTTFDTWGLLAYLMARTDKIHLGTMVSPIPRYAPGNLAKIVSTVDLISRGRAFLGVGAGYSQREFDGYSYWDPPRVRVDKTEEGLELILRLWTEKMVDFHGNYYTARNAVLEPKPVQKPNPPLLFGGAGKLMLRMAGKHSDICLVPPWSKIPFQEAKAIVVETAKRYNRVNRVAFADTDFRPKFDAKANHARVEDAQDRGCEYFQIGFWSDNTLDSMRQFAKDIIPSYNRSNQLVTVP